MSNPLLSIEQEQYKQYNLIKVPNSFVYTYPSIPYKDFTSSQLYCKYFNITDNDIKPTYIDNDIDYRDLESFIYENKDDYIKTIDEIYGINLNDLNTIIDQLESCMKLSKYTNKTPYTYFSINSIYSRNIENCSQDKYRQRLFNFIVRFKCKNYMDINYPSYNFE